MPIISFWNSEKIETGKTLSIVAIATYMALRHNYRVLVISTQFNDTTLKDCFVESGKEQLLSEITNNKSDIATGIEGLAKAVLSNKSTPEIITNYTKIIFKDRLELLLGATTDNYEEYKKIASTYKDIAQFANKHYDMVFVDLENGNDENNFADEILMVSDLIIYNFTQKLKTINKIIELKKTNKHFVNGNMMLSIGRYDMNSKYSTKNVARYLGERKETLAVPYCILFAEAASEGKVAEYFIKYNKITDETDKNAIFIQTVQSTVGSIIYRLQELQMKY